MKNILKKLGSIITVLALLGMSTASAGIQNRDTQTVINGNFSETNISYSNGVGGWSASQIALASAVITDPTDSANTVLRVAPDSSSSFVYQVCLTPGKTYRIKGKARSPNLIGGVPRLYIDSGYPWIGTGYSSTTEWQYFDFIYTVTTYTFLRLYSSTAVGGVVDFDDVSITPYNGTVQNRDTTIASNGNFENGTTSWQVSSSTLSSISAPAGTEGTKAIKIEQTNFPAGGYAFQSVITAGVTYKVTALARGDGVSTTRILLGNTTNCFSTTLTTDWRPVSCTMVASGNTALYIGVLNASSNGWAEFDNISVTRYNGTIQNRDTNILADGNQEKAGTASYGGLNSPTLSKELGSVDGQGLQILRVAYNATAVYYATTTGLSAVPYRLRGYMRSSGAGVSPRVAFGGSTDFTGTASTTWQYFDITGAPTNGVIYYGTSNASGWTEFDNITVTRVY